MKKILEIFVFVAFMVMCFVLLVEWISGCGETYVDATGKRRQYECAFIPITVSVEKP